MSSHSSIPGEFLGTITRELSGERILWAGQPSPEMTFRKALPLWAMGIPTTAVAGVAEYFIIRAIPDTTAKANARLIDIFGVYGFAIFTALFVALGIFLLLLPWIARSKARLTVHVLTDKRLVTAVMGARTKISSIEPRKIISMEREEHAGGLGTLKMTLGWTRDSDGGVVENSEVWLGIPGVRGLELHLREQLSGLKG